MTLLLVDISTLLRRTDSRLDTIYIAASETMTSTNCQRTTFSGVGDLMKSSTSIRLTHGVIRFTPVITKNSSIDTARDHL